MGRAAFDPEQQQPQVNYGGAAPPPYAMPPQARAMNMQQPPPPQEEPLLCNGLGLGWLLFIIGFFTGIPWYVGAVLLFCGKDKREKPGCIACLVMAVILTIVIIINIAVAASASSDTTYYG